MRPREALVICASPRTGSGLLSSALWSTNLCGRPDEYLGLNTRREYEEAWGCRGNEQYAKCVLSHGTTPNGVFGIKVQAKHLRFTSWLVDDGQGLAGVADRVHFCRLRRRDRVRQAVSAYIAKVTGRYVQQRSDGARDTECVPFDDARIQDEMTFAKEEDRHWSRYFAALGLQPIDLWYEDDLEADYVETTRRLLESIGIEAPAELTISTGLQKQADEQSEMLVRRFLQARGAG